MTSPSQTEVIKSKLAGDTADLRQIFVENPEKTNFLNECFEVACEFGHVNTVADMLNFPPLYNNISILNFYCAGMGGNFDIINMVADACLRTHVVNYEANKEPWETKKREWDSGREKRIAVAQQWEQSMNEFNFGGKWLKCKDGVDADEKVYRVASEKFKACIKCIDDLERIQKEHTWGTNDHETITQWLKNKIEERELCKSYIDEWIDCRYHNNNFVKYCLMTPQDFETVMWLECMKGACVGGHVHVVKCYVETNPKICNHEFFKQCWEYACISGSTELVKYIMSQWVCGLESLKIGYSVASNYRHYELARLFINKGINPSKLHSEKTMILLDSL